MCTHPVHQAGTNSQLVIQRLTILTCISSLGLNGHFILAESPPPSCGPSTFFHGFHILAM
jgi:hypothetical protein